MVAMTLLRNPFRKSPQLALPLNKSTESFHSASTAEDVAEERFNQPHRTSFRASPSSGINSSSPIRTRLSDEEPGTYQLSVVNDSGVFIPPSPPERTGNFWRRKEYQGRRSTDRDSLDEPFTISRESFESYRRSFDISARSPVATTTLDSEMRSPLGSFDSKHTKQRVVETANSYDGLEEIKLDEQPSRPRKRGIFSRFGGDNTPADGHSPSGGLTFKFALRKEPLQDNELAKISTPREELILN